MNIRTTVTLTSDSVDVLKRESRRRRVSTSQLVREAVQKVYGPPAGEKRILPFEFLGHSGQPGIVDRLDEILAEEWADDILGDS